MSLHRGIKVNFFLWSRVHRLPRFFVERWHVVYLKRLVNLAYVRVPLYRRLFHEHGISSRDIQTLADLERLPIISKQQLRAHPLREIMHDSFPAGQYEWRRTSGSTGEPFIFPSTNLALTLDDDRFSKLSHFRFLLWDGVRRNDVIRGRFRVARVRVEPISAKGYLFIPMVDVRRDPQAVFRQLMEYRPLVLESVATVLLELARLAPDHIPAGEKLSIPYLVSYGEQLSQGARALIRGAFGGSDEYNLYGLGETQDIGIECSAHDGFHVYEESFIIEILDDKDRRLPLGASGRVVVTSLYNDVMPIIRYDTGDRGMIIPEPCPCGLRARRIRIDGREGGFVSIGGKKFNHVEFIMALDQFGGSILKYQLAKVSEHNLELRVVPSRLFSDAAAEQLRAHFIKNFAFEPAIKLVDRIPAAASGKTPVIVDETTG